MTARSLPAEAEASEGYRFAGWYADGAPVSREQRYVFAVDGDLSLEARFEPEPEVFQIRVSAGQGGTAGIVIGSETALSAAAEAGSTITVIAAASEGYTFEGWYEGEQKVYGQERVEFTVERDVSLQARFTEAENPEQGGTQEPEEQKPGQPRSRKAKSLPSPRSPRAKRKRAWRRRRSAGFPTRSITARPRGQSCV